MALVTEKISLNAKKCKECVLQRVRDYIKFKKKMAGKGVFDKDTAMAFNKGADAVARFGCNLCPYKDDFRKVFGMTPADFFSREQLRLEK